MQAYLYMYIFFFMTQRLKSLRDQIRDSQRYEIAIVISRELFLALMEFRQSELVHQVL